MEGDRGQSGRLVSLPHTGWGTGHEQAEKEPTMGRRRKKGNGGHPEPGQRWGPGRGFHLENLLLHELQPPQHPGQGQCPLAGRAFFAPPQLQVRLGSGSAGPARALATGRHLVYLSEHMPRHNRGGELERRQIKLPSLLGPLHRPPT